MSGTTSIKAINAIAIARGTSEPSNRNVLWLDENITGSFYKIIKSFNSESGTWELLSRSNSELLSDLKTVDGKGSGLDADTLHGLTPAELLGGELSSLPDLSIGQIIAGQADTIGVAKTVGGVVTMDADGNFAYTPNSISHTGLTDIGTNTHAQIDSKLASIDNIEGNLTNIGTLGASEDGYSIAWDNATSRFIPTAGGNSIYTADGTIGAGRVATLTDSLGIKSANTFGGFYVEKSTTTDKVFEVKGNGSGNWFNSSSSYISIGEGASANHTRFTNNGLDIHKGAITKFRFQSGGNELINLFEDGSINGTGSHFIINSNAVIGSEKISLQSSTAIKGTGTAGSSALAIYDNDTTPNKLWDFLDNGDLTGIKSKVKLIARNSTSNSDSDYILRLRASNDASDRFFVGNGGEVRLGNANNTGTGDKSTHIMWGADVVTKAGSGNYAILMGDSITANYSGTGVVGLGRSLTLNGQGQVALGRTISLASAGSFGVGLDLSSTAENSTMMGNKLTTSGTFSTLIGYFLESTATGASVIGKGLSNASKLVNSTANSLALGWNTATPQHLLSSTGATLGGKTELSSTEDGLLMNRLTTAQRDAISTPDTHLLIFNTDNERIERYDGVNWVGETGGGGNIYTTDGTLTGNRVVSFAGQSLDFNTYATNGSIGIGDANDSTSNCALTVRATTGKTQTLNLLTNSKNGLASFHEGLITMFAPSYSAVGTEDISLQKPTAIKGTGTSGDSALAIYDNDTTPNKLWDFLDNGDLNGNNNRILNTIVNPSVNEATTSGFLLINSDEQTMGVLTAMASGTSIASPTGTPVQGQSLIIRLKDDGTARAITWNAIFRAIGITLPTTTTANKLLYVGCKYNSTDTKWDVVSVQEEA